MRPGSQVGAGTFSVWGWGHQGGAGLGLVGGAGTLLVWSWDPPSVRLGTPGLGVCGWGVPRVWGRDPPIIGPRSPPQGLGGLGMGMGPPTIGMQCTAGVPKGLG